MLGLRSSDHVLLFVYGTLRRGEPNHSLLQKSDFLGDTTLVGSLFDLGEYPALHLDGAGTVYGEVWRTSDATIAALDDYEGVGQGLFDRVRVRLPWGEGWAYVAGPVLRGALRADRRIPTGRWRTPPAGRR